MSSEPVEVELEETNQIEGGFDPITETWEPIINKPCFPEPEPKPWQ